MQRRGTRSIVPSQRSNSLGSIPFPDTRTFSGGITVAVQRRVVLADEDHLVKAREPRPA